MSNLASFIRDIPDFPKPGIIFKDITPLLADAAAFDQSIRELAAPFRGKGVDKVVAVEARGFIFGAAVARELGAGFVPIRKPGKLPYRTVSVSYQLEYGTDTIAMHEDALKAGEKILIVDDLLATGGTIGGTLALLEKAECDVVGIAFVIELDFLHGREKLAGQNIHSLIHY